MRSSLLGAENVRLIPVNTDRPGTDMKLDFIIAKCRELLLKLTPAHISAKLAKEL